MEACLIIDIGTGNARVAVATPGGEILSVEREDVHYEKDLHYPEAIYFDPDELWLQIRRLAKSALGKVPQVKIVAVTATSQREGIVLIGQGGESLIGLPNIDHRGREWEHEIADRRKVYELAGRWPTSLFSAMKLVGIRNRRPEIWSRYRTFLSISDWVQYKLCGVMGYEHSQASETLLYDVAGRRWSNELCAAFGIDVNTLAPLVSSGEVLGMLSPVLAGEFSALTQAPVIVGGADTQLAVESTQPSVNDMVIVSGTTTPIIKVMNNYVVDDDARTWTSRYTHGDAFMLEANAGVTGLNYQRLKEIFYPRESYDVIEEELGAMSCSQCVASLGSLLADEQHPLTRGGFIFDVPVSHELTRASFVWATLWDIACSIRENYRALCAVTTHDQDYIWACGGGMQSPLLRRLIANLLDKEVKIRTNFRQSSVVGGAYICGRRLHGAEQSPAAVEIIRPDDQRHFEALYEEWKKARAGFRQIA
jgi:autoinducer 2 (AI-2) kinase